VQGLLHVAAAQQAESSASRRRGAATEKHPEPARNEREVSVHREQPPRSWSALSTIESLATLKATSTSIDAANTVTLRNEATTPTVADATIVTRTGWLQSHQVLESSVGRSVARHCRARSDPRPASPNTTAKPSQNYGWRIFGWHASWEALEETIEPSSSNCRFSSPTHLLVFAPVQALRCKIIHTLPPAGRRAFFCLNQDKSLCHSCITIRKGEHAHKFTRWCYLPGSKHLTGLLNLCLLLALIYNCHPHNIRGHISTWCMQSSAAVVK